MKEKKPFKKGQDVRIIDKGDIYLSYSQMIKRHMKYAIHWAYKDQNPDTDALYVVKGVYKHCRPDPYDKNKWCVVIENIKTHQIYLIGELGLQDDMKFLKAKIKEYETKLDDLKRDRLELEEL